MNFIACLSGGRLSTFGFLFFPAVLLAVTLIQQNPPVRPADSPVLIWDVDPSLAKALPRNFRTTDDSLKASDGKPPSTTGLVLRECHVKPRQFKSGNVTDSTNAQPIIFEDEDVMMQKRAKRPD